MINEPIGIFKCYQTLDIGYVELFIINKSTYDKIKGCFIEQVIYTVKNLTTDKITKLTEQQLIKLYYGK